MLPATRGPHLTGHDRDHGLVQQGQAVAYPAVLHQGAAVELQRERDQVRVADAGADLGGPSGRRLRGLVVTCGGRLNRDRKQQRPCSAHSRRSCSRNAVERRWLEARAARLDSSGADQRTRS